MISELMILELLCEQDIFERLKYDCFYIRDILKKRENMIHFVAWLLVSYFGYKASANYLNN